METRGPRVHRARGRLRSAGCCECEAALGGARCRRVARRRRHSASRRSLSLSSLSLFPQTWVVREPGLAACRGKERRGECLREARRCGRRSRARNPHSRLPALALDELPRLLEGLLGRGHGGLVRCSWRALSLPSPLSNSRSLRTAENRLVHSAAPRVVGGGRR